MPDFYLSADGDSYSFEEYELEADLIRYYLDGNELPDDLQTLLDQLQGDAKTQGKAHYLIITVKP